MTTQPFVTTTRGLDRSAPAMRLFEKAKQFGIWNPAAIDFSADQQQWAGLNSAEKTFILHVISLFQGGEEAVTLDLLPLIMTIAREGRLEEEMFLTTFLWEEAKHVDFFARFLEQVAGSPGDLTRFESEPYRLLFHHELPQALHTLLTDPSPEAQVRASVTYNMIVEGVLAETGYHGLFTLFDRHGLMPGLRDGIYRLKQDESRHIAYGIYLISRHLSADPSLWSVVEERLDTLLPLAMGVIGDIFARYDPVPFGLELNDFALYALGQFHKRRSRLEHARSASQEALNAATLEIIESGDA
jgi:ribonucleoside-diphosphate reductase beta chain